MLQSRTAHDAKALAVALETTERTVYRDLNALGLAGISCVYTPERGGYVLLGDYRFTVLKPTRVELFGLATASALTSAKGLDIGAGAGPTSQKLRSTANEADRRLLEDAQRVTSVLDLKLANHEGHRETIRTIQEALVEKHCLEGTYSSPYQSGEKLVLLHPIRVCLVKSAWYLVARPDGSDHAVTYRVARFRSLRKLLLSSDVPAEFDLRAYFGNAWSVFRGNRAYEVELRFLPEAATIVTETIWHHTQQVHRNDDGSVTLSFEVDGLEEIIWWIMGWSGVVEVVRPTELRSRYLAHLTKATALNGG